MGQKSYLAVEGGDEICMWQYTPQISDYQWFIFNYIFNNKDKKMEYEGGDDDLFGCRIIFSSSLADVKDKFEKLNYTEEKINLFFQEFFDVDNKKAKKMIDAYFEGDDDPEGFDAKFGKGSYDFYNEKDLWDADLGEIPLIAILLNEIKNNPNKNLLLAIDYRYSQEKKDYWKKLKIISDDDSTEIRIVNKYICMAKVCYSKGELPNVYINLIMGLEYSIRDYILRKKENLSKDSKNDMLNLDNMLKNLSLMDSLKFSIIYLGDDELDTTLFEKVQKVYGIRNNLMHQGMKKFDYVKCAEAIQTIEEIIEKINLLS
jgi:hypothetical protein